MTVRRWFVKASEAKFLSFMQGTHQFIIPIYQRTYSWTLKQCKQLWDDVVWTATNPSASAHFIGSVVYIERSLYHVSTSVPQLLVIDGQQRLTTLSLLLAALGEAVESSGTDSQISRRRINNYYLFNAEEDGQLRYKLVLTRNDRETLTRLLDDTPLPSEPSRRIMDNYNYFKEQIRRSGISADTIFSGLQKLVIVDIALNRDHDNPQLIFESLNSTGLELSQADLVRNYVLMGLEPAEQEAIYRDYWFPMEQGFGHSDYSALFDRFMRDYLTVKTGRIPNVREIYDAFKSYTSSLAGENVDDIVRDIHRFATYFTKLALSREPDPLIRAAIMDINELTVYVAYPFFLQLYDDYERQQLNGEDFVAILRLVESYVIRRAICGIPTNSLNQTFQTLGKEIITENYLESIEAAFQSMDSYRRYPDDAEFQQAFSTRDIYNLTKRRHYLLRKLVNHGRKELLNVESLTIKHVLPQNPQLSETWQKELGPDWQSVQAKYLHTIGNLTLTGYNPELSDRPFLEKRDMEGGFKDSPVRLNRDLAHLERWGEAEISARAERLASLACQVWPAPKLDVPTLETYRKVKPLRLEAGYTVTNHKYLTGDMLTLFELLREQILDIDQSVVEEVLKLYIAYKTTTNFVDVVPQKSRLRLSINMDFEDIDDPRGWCKDVTNLGRWGNGDVEVRMMSPNQLDYIMYLIRQSFVRRAEGVLGI